MSNERGELTQADESGGALEDIAYLARSSNRIRLLEALAAGPRSRRDLDEATDASGTTLGRILSEFEQRDWARRRPDGDYEATAVGRQIADEFIPLVGSVSAIQRLGEAVEWLPTDELSIGLHHFSDATVRRPARGDPVEIVDEFVDQLERSSRFATLTDLVPPKPILAATHAGAVAGDLSVTVVTTGDAIAYASEDPDRRRMFADLLEAGASLSWFDGDPPCTLFVFDDVVWIKQSEPDAVHPSYGVPIETTNDTVREWALETIESHRATAEPIPSEVASASSTTVDADET